MLLSDSIRDNVPRAFAAFLAQSSVVNLQTYFHAFDPSPPREPVFGVFGNTGDGRLFAQVASLVKTRNPDIRFRLVGFLADQPAVDRLTGLADGLTTEPISRAAFVKAAASLTHVLWLAPIGAFRLRASASFLDALQFLKPLIYTANPYIDGFGAVEAGIAVRCESPDDVADAIIAAYDTISAESYAAEQTRLLEFRARFSPQAQASRMAGIFGK